MPEESPSPPAVSCNHLQHAKARDKAMGKSTADKAPDANIGEFLFLCVLQEKKRADERTRTAFPLITSALLAIWVQPNGLLAELLPYPP